MKRGAGANHVLGASLDSTSVLAEERQEHEQRYRDEQPDHGWPGLLLVLFCRHDESHSA